MADIAKPTPGSTGWNTAVDALFDDHNSNPLTDGTVTPTELTRLDDIASIDPATAGVLATDGAGWLRKTYSALKTSLALVKGDVGLGNVDNTSDANKPVSTAQATSIGARVAKTGDTMTGDLTVASLLAIVMSSIPANTQYLGNKITTLAQAPFANLWHDLLAFNRIDTPDFETSADGTTFVAGTLDNSLFCSKDGMVATPTINGTTMIAQRWTWNSNGFAFSSGQWLVIGFRYDGGSSTTKRVVFESSADGTNWTTRHTSTTAVSSTPVWFYVTTFGGDTYLRVTVTWLSGGGTVGLSTMRLLTYRWGDQGNGAELSVPYTWDKDGNIGIKVGYTSTINEPLHVGGNVKITGGIYNQILLTRFNTADYTLVAVDSGRLIEMNSASPLTLTVPTNASVPFPVGSFVTIRQAGAGQVTVAGSGTTLRSFAGLKLAGQWAEARLTKRGTDEWVLSGQTTT